MILYFGWLFSNAARINVCWVVDVLEICYAVMCLQRCDADEEGRRQVWMALAYRNLCSGNRVGVTWDADVVDDRGVT